MPSISQPESLVITDTPKPELDFRKGELPARFDYSVAPQLTFFTPVSGTRLTVGGGVSAVRMGLQDLTHFEGPLFQAESGSYVPRTSTIHDSATLNLYNASLIAAYTLGAEGRTSIGIGLDHLSGKGSYFSETHRKYQDSSIDNIVTSKAQLARTRVTLGFAHEFSGGRKLGVYLRNGLSSSDQRYDQRLTANGDYLNSIDYYLLPFNKAAISTVTSELGVRWRAPLTRRIFYGVEGSYLYETIDSRRSLGDKVFDDERDRAQRARFGGGVGYFFKSRTVFDLDVAGGFYKSSKPQGYYLIDLYDRTSERERGKFLSAHASMQTNLWRQSFVSASFLLKLLSKTSLHGDSVINLSNSVLYSVAGDEEGSTSRETNKFATVGFGWKLKPNLIAQYLLSIDQTPYSRRIPSHSLMFRYTFDLKNTKEK